MSYYGTGDYYLAGDPGFFSSIGGFIKRAAGGIVGGLTGGLPGAIQGIAARSGGGGGPPVLVTPAPGMLGTIQRTLPGGSSGYVDASGMVRKRRRRMNYGNAKALRRSIRRQDGFVRLARGALKGTNYKIVSRSAGRSSKPTYIKESGAGSVIVS